MNLNILPVVDELQLQPQEVPRLTLRKMTNIRQYEESALRKDVSHFEHYTILQELSNFEEFTLPGNSSTFGVSKIRNLTRQKMRPVGECHVPDTPIATCQEKSWPRYVKCGVSMEVRTLIFNGTRF